MHYLLGRSCLVAGSLAVFPGAVAGQGFADNQSQIPQGNPFNNSLSENVDFADVDLDGDWDAAFADGGDTTLDQDRLWINAGGLQGGVPGFFTDQTATRCPALLDQSRDIEFADLDADGDPDIAVANTSSITPASCRFWVNLGGMQGGTLGFFQDQTATRWVGLAGPGSSIAPGLVLAGGGWLEYGSDVEFGDLDSDGDLDEVVSSVGQGFSGKIPMRIFLNDGQGYFSELNPSGHQLAGQDISDGEPGLWCEGLQQAGTTNATGQSCDVASQAIDLDLGDLDGDLDLDLVVLHRDGPARAFENRLERNAGTPGFRDVTGALFPPGSQSGGVAYELELGDLDDDDDLDLYGLNWAAFSDVTLRNDGGGSFSDLTVLSGSGWDDEEGDFLDYDADGDLDLFVANFAGQDHLYRNGWTGGGFSFTPDATALPVVVLTSRDADVADVDGDGDYDLFEANSQRNVFFENLLGAPDVHAPRLSKLEQAPDRISSILPSVVRVQVYDNAPDYVTWYDPTSLEYRVDGGPWYVVPMRSSGGQVFRGEIPGTLIGNLEYRVRSSDGEGNSSLSASKSFTASDGGCNGAPGTYCTAKATSIPGCLPALGFNGTPSASAGSGFHVSAGPVPGQNSGLFVYTTQGALGTPIQNAFGFLCIDPGPGFFRLPYQAGGGSTGVCNGQYQVDFNAYVATQTQDPALIAGAQVDLQAWYRDPPNAGSANLTGAATFTLCR